MSLSFSTRSEQIDFTADELVQYRAMLKYADGGYEFRNRLSVAETKDLDPYLHPVKHSSHRGAFLEVDGHSDDGSDTESVDMDAEGDLNAGRPRRGGGSKRRRGAQAHAPGASAPFALGQGRLRKFIKSLVRLLHAQSTRR